MAEEAAVGGSPTRAIGARADRSGSALAHNGGVQTVLVVEDERDVRELLCRYLERAGLAAVSASTGAEGLRLLDDHQPDLMLLDLGLPDIDGLELLATAVPRTPVIVLTARTAFDDRITGLTMGAQDYVVKPFSPTEVVLRVQSVLSRAPDGPPDRSGLRVCDGRIAIDEEGHHASLDGQELSLSPGEWALLVALASAPGRVFSRQELVERIHGYTFDGYERAIDSHVKNLRHKLGPQGRDLVETVVGFGYRLECEHPDRKHHG